MPDEQKRAVILVSGGLDSNIRACAHMANLATKAGVEGGQKLKIHTPLIRMTKAEIVRTGLELGVDFSLTSSCYDPSALPRKYTRA